ncbi:MAG: prephenate dehydratase [Lachnospiraceae bacterium]|jgi:Prephenate dehydratase|nr:prephenate dehydratase [Lachnospiraceae bacterium]
MVVDLKESREKIDKIDRQIAELFEKRMTVAADVAAYKRSTGKKVFDPVREDEKIKALREMTDNEFNKTGIEDLFRQIMSISRKYQYNVLGTENDLKQVFRQVNSFDVDSDTRIVCFGEHGAYTEQAMEEVFGKNITAINKSTFKDVMETVAGGEAKFGVLPIENTSTGGITDIYDLLLDYDVTIVAEHVVKVEQALMGLPGTSIEDIKMVYSHPQGLMQCAKFLEEHPGILTKTYSSTSAAAKKVAEDGNRYQAAIASSRAADIFGLDIIKEKINYESKNYTRFIIISNQKIFLSSASKISLSFEIKHQAGALYNMLSNFYYNGLNLTKIESRPIENRNWEYRFFVDIEGNLNEPEVGNALASISEFANKLVVLGNIVTIS